MHYQLISFILYYCIHAALTSDIGECDRNWVYFQKSCYYLGDVHKDWSAAERICKADGASLAEITSAEEDTFLRNQINGIRRRQSKRGFGPDYWIGGTDHNREGSWHWQNSDQPIVYKNFANGQPNDESGNEDCLEMNLQLNGKWNDDNCYTKEMYICERPSKSAVIGSAVG